MVWYTQQYQVQCCLTRDLLAVGFAIQETIRSTRALMAFCLTCWCTMLSFCCATLGWAEKANLCREMRKTLFLNDIALLKAKELILLIQNQMKKKESTKKGKLVNPECMRKLSFKIIKPWSPRVSTHPEKQGNPECVVVFVVEFTIFRVLSWKCLWSLFYHSPIFHSHYFCILSLAILSCLF